MWNLFRRRIFAVLPVLLIFLTHSASAAPISWGRLTEKFHNAVIYKGQLRPSLQEKIERFFVIHFDRSPEQLLYVENRGQSLDSVLDFIVFRCHGVLKQHIRAGQERFNSRAVEHLMFQAIERLKELNYEQLCFVINAAVGGKYNVFSTLTERKLFDSRNRLIYFLIERATEHGELSHQETARTPSLRDLIKRALSEGRIRRLLEEERDKLEQPLADSWEQVVFIPNFFEKWLQKKDRLEFLTQALTIVGGL